MLDTVIARRGVPLSLAFAIALSAFAAPAAAVITPSWNGYRWARTGTLGIKTVNRTSSEWRPYFNASVSGWSAASQIDLIPSKGTYNPRCGAVYSTIQVCSGSYGANGWLGYANVWLSGSFIVQATVRLNDSYFGQNRYNTSAWRSATMCQEIGHTLGLAHNNEIRSDANTGSCMDYSNDPDGGGRYGASNEEPGAVDFAGLNVIYRRLDKTQLPGTKLSVDADGLFLPGFDHDHAAGAVPEPSAWAMLIAGFGLIGGAARRARKFADA